MDGLSLSGLYKFLIDEAEMPNFMLHNQYIDLLPSPNVEYRDKIQGAMVGVAFGDAVGTHFESQLQKEADSINNFLKNDRYSVSLNTADNTEMLIMVAESLIIHQKFHPEDMANRFIRKPITKIKNTIGEFIVNYRDRRLEWYKSGSDLSGHDGIIRGIPIGLINYGDFISLKLMAGIQTIITHKEQMAIASSIFQAIAVAYLVNLPPYSLKHKKDILKFIDICGEGIKDIESRLAPRKEQRNIINLYTRTSIELRDAIERDIDSATIRSRWEGETPILGSLSYAIYSFLKNPNDFEKILKESLLSKDTDFVAGLSLSLAGAYLGYNNIPEAYKNKLGNLDEMLALGDRLFELSLINKLNNPYRRMKDTLVESMSQDELHTLMWEGIKHIKRGEYQNAVRHLEDLVEKYPEAKENGKIRYHIIDAYEGLGTKFLEDERYDDALKIFRKALAYDLNHPAILCDLAITYLNLDDLQKAERYVRRSVEIAPEYEIGREVLQAINSIKKGKH